MQIKLFAIFYGLSKPVNIFIYYSESMDSHHNPQNDPYLLHSARHCPTCHCGDSHNFYQWKSQKKPVDQPTIRASRLLQSRVVPPSDPASREVGDSVIPNRTVWFKSVSSRPNRITITVSSPDKPNLRPTLTPLSLHKRACSESTLSFGGLQTSRMIINSQQILTTPVKQLIQKNSIEQQEQSTMYSPFQTQRRPN